MVGAYPYFGTHRSGQPVGSGGYVGQPMRMSESSLSMRLSASSLPYTSNTTTGAVFLGSNLATVTGRTLSGLSSMPNFGTSRPGAPPSAAPSIAATLMSLSLYLTCVDAQDTTKWWLRQKQRQASTNFTLKPAAGEGRIHAPARKGRCEGSKKCAQ